MVEIWPPMSPKIRSIKLATLTCQQDYVRWLESTGNEAETGYERLSTVLSFFF